MSDLSMRTARRDLERALTRAIANAYKVRVNTPTATIAALRAVPSLQTPPDTYRYVTSAGYAFYFDRYSSLADNGSTVLRPDDVASTKPGRWIRSESTVSSGYLQNVSSFNGESTIEEVLDRLMARRPSVLAVFTGAKHEAMSMSPGTLYWYRPTYDLWVISTNLRDGNESEFGSPIASEDASDPGVVAIIGDLKTLLAGSDLGVTGVDFVEIGDEVRIAQDLDQRIALEKLTITINASVQNPTTDQVELSSLYVQRQLAATPVGDLDADYEDTIRSGMRVTVTPASLTSAVAAGTAYVGTTLVSYAGEAKTFTASKWTYRDLADDGTMTFTAVDPWMMPPSQTDGTLRVGITVTDENGITADNLIANSLEDYGDPDQVDLT